MGAQTMLLIPCAWLAGPHFAGARGTGQSNAKLCPELNGTVTYMEKMLLPRVAEVRITLLDIADRKNPKVIIEKLIPTEGRQVPIRFKVPLARGSINPSRGYSVKAEILIGGKVWFVTNEAIPVLTGGSPCAVDIVLNRSS